MHSSKGVAANKIPGALAGALVISRIAGAATSGSMSSDAVLNPAVPLHEMHSEFFGFRFTLALSLFQSVSIFLRGALRLLRGVGT
jgi:hypothetical protein